MSAEPSSTSPSSAAGRSASRARGAPPSGACAWPCSTRGEPGAWTVAAGMLAPVAEADRGEEPLLRLGPAGRRGLRRLLRGAGRGLGPRPGPPRQRHARGRARPRRRRGARPRSSPSAAPLGLRVGAPAALARPPRRARARARPCASRSTSPATTPSTRARSSPRWPRRSSAPAARVRPRTPVARAAASRATACAASCCATASTVPAERVAARRRRPRRAAGGPPARGRRARTPGQGPGPAAARPRRARAARPHGPHAAPPTSSRAADGRYVLGATMEEQGFHTAPTAGGVVRARCATSARSSRACSSSRWRRCWPACGPRRPTTCRPSARARSTGLYWATGHHRNGILLSGLSGELAAAALCGEPLPGWAAAVDPARFAPALAEGRA